MIIKEVDINELKMNGLEINFDRCRLFVEKEHVEVFAGIELSFTDWRLEIEGAMFDECLSKVMDSKMQFVIDLKTVKGEELLGKGIISEIGAAMEGKPFLEGITGVGALGVRL